MLGRLLVGVAIGCHGCGRHGAKARSETTPMRQNACLTPIVAR